LGAIIDEDVAYQLVGAAYVLVKLPGARGIHGNGIRDGFLAFSLASRMYCKFRIIASVVAEIQAWMKMPLMDSESGYMILDLQSKIPVSHWLLVNRSRYDSYLTSCEGQSTYSQD
jgi:hypothetical protein